MPPVPMPPPPGASSPNGMPMQGMNTMPANGMNGMSGMSFMNMQSPQQQPQQGVSDLSNGGSNAPSVMQQPRVNSIQGNQMNMAQGQNQGQPQHSGSSGSGGNTNNSSNSAGGRRRHNSRDGNGSHAIGDGEFGLNIDHIMQGVDRRTTVMIRNIPNKYTQVSRGSHRRCVWRWICVHFYIRARTRASPFADGCSRGDQPALQGNVRLLLPPHRLQEQVQCGLCVHQFHRVPRHCTIRVQVSRPSLEQLQQREGLRDHVCTHPGQGLDDIAISKLEPDGQVGRVSPAPLSEHGGEPRLARAFPRCVHSRTEVCAS